MTLSGSDWQRLLINFLHIILVCMWCVWILNATLGKQEANKAILKRTIRTFCLVLIPMFFLILSVKSIDNYLEANFYLWDMMLVKTSMSYVYLIYNTIYIIVPTIFSYVLVRRLYAQDQSVKTFFAVLTGLVAIIINEFVYRLFLLPFLQTVANSETKVMPNQLLALGIQLACLVVLYFGYKRYLCSRMKAVLDTPDGRMTRFVKVPVISNIIFVVMIAELQTFGIKMDAVKWIDLFIYIIVVCCLAFVYIMMYWSIFTGIHLSTEKMRSQAELDVASHIQSSVLPTVFPPYPDHQEFSIYANMVTAKEVGGDFYDFFFTDERHLVIIIADVSGKGVPASLFMMTARTLIKSIAMSGASVEDVFYKANDSLCENNEAEMFVTAWMGKLDIYSGHLTFVNAGHNPPLWFHQNAPFTFMDTYRRSLMLGVREHVVYHKNEIDLYEEDTLYLYTDGVSEANNHEGQLYGEERLKRCLNECKKQTPESYLAAVHEDVNVFVNGATQFDDITMLAVQIKQLKEVLHVHVAAANMQQVTAFVEDYLQQASCEQKVIHEALLSVDEIFSNIVKYSEANEAVVTCFASQDEVTISFMDDGLQYNPLEEDIPDIDVDLSQRRIGGLGIHVVKNVMDTMDYAYLEGRNVLKIQKRCQS